MATNRPPFPFAFKVCHFDEHAGRIESSFSSGHHTSALSCSSKYDMTVKREKAANGSLFSFIICTIAPPLGGWGA